MPCGEFEGRWRIALCYRIVLPWPNCSYFFHIEFHSSTVIKYIFVLTKTCRRWHTVYSKRVVLLNICVMIVQ